MNSSIEFLERRDAAMKTLAIVQNMAPISIKEDAIIEINHREYLVGKINVIVSHTSGHITYQVHVVETD